MFDWLSSMTSDGVTGPEAAIIVSLILVLGVLGLTLIALIGYLFTDH